MLVYLCDYFYMWVTHKDSLGHQGKYGLQRKGEH